MSRPKALTGGLSISYKKSAETRNEVEDGSVNFLLEVSVKEDEDGDFVVVIEPCKSCSEITVEEEE
jgi:hypothetical protein